MIGRSVFRNEASMLSWVIETGHLDEDFVHSQGCILVMFCECLHRSIPIVLTRRKQQCWTKLFRLLQCLVCSEMRFKWSHVTTRQYTTIMIDRICECLDYSAFVLATDLRDLTLTQVLPMEDFVRDTRRRVLDGQLEQLEGNEPAPTIARIEKYAVERFISGQACCRRQPARNDELGGKANPWTTGWKIIRVLCRQLGQWPDVYLLS
jgi:hypothetical protein